MNSDEKAEVVRKAMNRFRSFISPEGTPLITIEAAVREEFELFNRMKRVKAAAEEHLESMLAQEDAR